MGCSATYTTTGKTAEFLKKLTGFDLESAPLSEDVEDFIAMSAANIIVTLQMTGQCDCTFSSWAAMLVENLNLIGTALLIYGNCGVGLTDDQRAFWSTWLGDQLKLLRDGELDLCAGATGPTYPAYGTATRGYTEWQKAQLVLNDLLRNL